MSELGVFRNVMNKDRHTLRRPVLRDIVPCLLLLLSSRASVLGLFPFAVAMFAALFDKSAAYLGIAVLCLGFVSVGAGITIIKYAFAAVLFWLYTMLREDYKENAISSSVVCGCCLFIGGCTLMIYNFSGTYDFLMLIIESIICAVMYVVFDKGGTLTGYSRNNPTEQELISAAICVGVFITGLSGLTLPFGISLSRCFTVYAVMCIALHESLAVAGSGGLAAGLICSMNDLAAVTLMGLYGLSGLFGNLLKAFGKYGVSLGFLGGATITLLYVGNSFSIPLSITEVAVSVCAFVLTPNKVHNLMGSYLKKTLHMEIVPSEVRIREYLAMRLGRGAKAFTALEECFKSVTDRRLKTYGKDICTILDDVSDRICRDCPNRSLCWEEEFSNTYRLVFTLLETMEKEGACTLRSMPEEFRGQCVRKEFFLMEFHHVYEIYKSDVIKMGEARQGRDLLRQQYKEVSGLMEDMAEAIQGGFRFLEDSEQKIAEELEKASISVREVSVIEGANGDLEVYLSLNQGADRNKVAAKLTTVLKTPMGYVDTCWGGLLKFTSKGIFQVDMGSRQISKAGQTVCGDSLSAFQTQDYKYYVILCDGMGSGKEACKESYMAGRLLEEFLRAGFGAKMSINMINSSLALKMDRESFSAVDLLCIDLMTGLADFYKIGGSKSYIKRGDEVETIFGESLPAGILSNVYVKGISKKLEPEDVIVMMSDGVSDGGFGVVASEKMKKLLDDEEKTTDDLAKAVLETVLKKKYNKASDDMTVAVLRIGETND